MPIANTCSLDFVASGAALVGIYGYSGYAPSKFAVRGLAEVLRVELREYGISVTLALPPDTNTPQLEFETKLRPTPTKEIAGVAGVWDPDKVALAIVTGARKGRFWLTRSTTRHRPAPERPRQLSIKSDARQAVIANPSATTRSPATGGAASP